MGSIPQRKSVFLNLDSRRRLRTLPLQEVGKDIAIRLPLEVAKRSKNTQEL